LKTTARHFKIFKTEFTVWQEKLGLLESRVDFWQTYLEDSYSTLVPNSVAKVASAFLCTDWGEDNILSDKAIRDTAKHEAIHLLGADMFTLGCSRFTTRDDLMMAYEAQTRRLEKML